MSVALLVPERAVTVGLIGPWYALPPTSGPADPIVEVWNSFCRRLRSSFGGLRLPSDAEAQSEERGRKMETRVRTWEEKPGNLTR